MEKEVRTRGREARERKEKMREAEAACEEGPTV